MSRIASLWIALVLATGCKSNDPPTGSDGGSDASAQCTSDDDCDDGQFCNGSEDCDPGDSNADSRGCAPGDEPCAMGCDEDQDECSGTGCDADGDGHDAIDCGGDDCDDNDADRYPGNTEICDDDHDEDCDNTTLGSDRDGDGYVGVECCNGAECGDDCDDGRVSVAPEANEVCNTRDDDCDGLVDEDVTATFYRDLDGDGFGTPDESLVDCSAPPGFALRDTDCDDTLAAVNPAAVEACEPSATIDDDCDGETNEDCECTGDETRACVDGMGEPLVGVCADGQRICVGGQLSDCTVMPSTEVCGDGLDQNCNGTVEDEIDVATGMESLAITTCSGLNLDPESDASGSTCSQSVAGRIGSVVLSRANRWASYSAYYDDNPVTLGYGELVFSPEVRMLVASTPGAYSRGGWGAVLSDMDGAPRNQLGGGLREWTGVPNFRTGLAIEWTYSEFLQGTGDHVKITGLNNTSSPVNIADCVAPDAYDVTDPGDDVTVQIEIRYRPANAFRGTQARVQVLIDSAVVCEATGGMVPAWTEGQSIWVGMTGATTGASDERTVSASWLNPTDGPTILGTCP